MMKCVQVSCPLPSPHYESDPTGRTEGVTSRALYLTSTLRRSPGRVTLLKGVDHLATSPDPRFGMDQVCHSYVMEEVKSPFTRSGSVEPAGGIRNSVGGDPYATPHCNPIFDPRGWQREARRAQGSREGDRCTTREQRKG
ncbi:hypothetical protein Pcinc_041740 [Petrolisthes cinctipes]|uniref:Uncharacterized protein n=1 Tax=Petrolisthes cinctipes TaxID=88211 RepID=A0AAE1BK54_PETCI|nr:hypothetical protein Pcinc_041740 [Petrolisthes cinctipes]